MAHESICKHLHSDIKNILTIANDLALPTHYMLEKKSHTCAYAGSKLVRTKYTSNRRESCSNPCYIGHKYLFWVDINCI